MNEPDIRLLASEDLPDARLPGRAERGVPRVFHARGPRRVVEARRRGHLGGDLRRAGGDVAPRRRGAVRHGRSSRIRGEGAATRRAR